MGEILTECVTGWGDVWTVELEADDRIRVIVDTVSPETASDLWAYVSPDPPPGGRRPLQGDDGRECSYPPSCGYSNLCLEIEGWAPYAAPRYIFVGLVGVEDCCAERTQYALTVLVNDEPVTPTLLEDDVMNPR